MFAITFSVIEVQPTVRLDCKPDGFLSGESRKTLFEPEEERNGQMETIVVTAAIIKQGNRYLITQRKKDRPQGLKWEFPGGKVEAGEDPEHCLQREINEELRVAVEVKKIDQIVSYNYGDQHIILLCYTCGIVDGKIQAVDCHDFRWVTPAEMARYEFAPADLAIVEKLRKKRLMAILQQLTGKQEK